VAVVGSAECRSVPVECAARAAVGVPSGDRRRGPGLFLHVQRRRLGRGPPAPWRRHTSLTTNKANAPDLAQLLRDHWGAIENKTHWVRDTTFNEDASTLRAGTAPHTMAIIPNTLIAAFRLTGWDNLKQARRHFSHAISRCVDLITKPLKTVKHQT
jgi:hypothetical protein